MIALRGIRTPRAQASPAARKKMLGVDGMLRGAGAVRVGRIRPFPLFPF
jgi:hypothetical protein